MAISFSNEKDVALEGYKLMPKHFDLSAYRFVFKNPQSIIDAYADWINKYIQNAQKGAFLQLNDMLETEAPKLKESIPDYLYDAVKVDGKLYAIPNIQVLFNQLGLIVFKDYADKHQFDFSTVKKCRT